MIGLIAWVKRTPEAEGSGVAPDRVKWNGKQKKYEKLEHPVRSLQNVSVAPLSNVKVIPRTDPSIVPYLISSAAFVRVAPYDKGDEWEKQVTRGAGFRTSGTPTIHLWSLEGMDNYIQRSIQEMVYAHMIPISPPPTLPHAGLRRHEPNYPSPSRKVPPLNLLPKRPIANGWVVMQGVVLRKRRRLWRHDGSRVIGFNISILYSTYLWCTALVAHYRRSVFICHTMPSHLAPVEQKYKREFHIHPQFTPLLSKRGISHDDNGK
ncbi:hypothetical protein DFH29DRAFT_882872 [Suillus ampliporus]|nr:hypothetical protein DFH29DRAFT_882872 [Suillus ampliporus]